MLALIIVTYVSEDTMKTAWRALNRGQEIAHIEDRNTTTCRKKRI
ncbi:hypothetical protein [Albidovulum aquaemixtae]|nr:hypothetical protein [Defluviimonas aquaemixtae]